MATPLSHKMEHIPIPPQAREILDRPSSGSGMICVIAAIKSNRDTQKHCHPQVLDWLGGRRCFPDPKFQRWMGHKAMAWLSPSHSTTLNTIQAKLTLLRHYKRLFYDTRKKEMRVDHVRLHWRALCNCPTRHLRHGWMIHSCNLFNNVKYTINHHGREWNW